MQPQTKRTLTVFALAMINVSLIASLRGLPTMAEYGLSIIFYLSIAIIAFLIPSALISAELATGWPKKGGVYAWVKEAFGERWGFLATWLQWSQNLIFYPTALAATAAMIAYIFMPSLASNKLYVLAIILIVYWGATLINMRGMKTSSRVSSFGVIAGILIPGILLIIMGIVWITMKQPIAIDLSTAKIIPDFSDIKNIAFLSGIFLFFAGMEVSAVHVREAKNPKRDYPRAIFLSAAIIAVIFIMGALIVAFLVPQSELSLTAGIMEAFQTVFNKFGLAWLIPVIAALAAAGLIAQVSSWIAGPSKALLATAEYGNLPPFFQKTNKAGMPIHIFLVQGIIVTAVSMVFIFMPSVSSSFWILTALTAILYLIMYIIMFVAVIKLRYSQPNVERTYKIPGGKFGIWFIGLLGIIGAGFAITVGFIPPGQLQTGGWLSYVSFLAIGIAVMLFAPLLIYKFKKPSWINKQFVNKNN
ncbi:amino acid permease [Patescibacteria group bacterium]